MRLYVSLTESNRPCTQSLTVQNNTCTTVQKHSHSWSSYSGVVTTVQIRRGTDFFGFCVNHERNPPLIRGHAHARYGPKKGRAGCVHAVQKHSHSWSSGVITTIQIGQARGTDFFGFFMNATRPSLFWSVTCVCMTSVTLWRLHTSPHAPRFSARLQVWTSLHLPQRRQELPVFTIMSQQVSHQSQLCEAANLILTSLPACFILPYCSVHLLNIMTLCISEYPVLHF